MMIKNIVASIIEVELSSDKYVRKPYPAALHGLCYYLAGEDYPHKKFMPPFFHPFIMNWKSGKWGTKVILQITSMDIELTERMLNSLQSLRDIRLGHGNLLIERFNLIKQEDIPLDPEQAVPVPNEFKIEFVTPTRFRTFKIDRYLSKAYPDLRLFIRSAARQLHLLYGVEIGLEEQEKLIQGIEIIHVVGYPVQVKIDAKAPYDDSFIGEMHLVCTKLSEKDKRLFGLLLKTAKYFGIGHKKGYGNGHIKIKRPSENFVL